MEDNMSGIGGVHSVSSHGAVKELPKVDAKPTAGKLETGGLPNSDAAKVQISTEAQALAASYAQKGE